MTPDFDHGAAHLESNRRNLALQGGQRLVRVELAGGPASLANQENGGMTVIPMAAGHEGVQAFDPVSEAHLEQEFQRAIDRRRLGGARGPDLFEQIVGFCRFRRFQEQGEDLAAQRRQPPAALNTQGFSLAQRLIEIFGRARQVSRCHGGNFGLSRRLNKGVEPPIRVREPVNPVTVGMRGDPEA